MRRKIVIYLIREKFICYNLLLVNRKIKASLRLVDQLKIGDESYS